jgi:hypothetical protein
LLQLNSRKIALLALFSGLYYVLSYLPGIKAIGVTTVTVNIEAFIASIFGLVLGPILGALTAFSGALLAWALPPGSPTATSLAFVPAPVINAFVVGLIYTKRWKEAIITLAIVIAAFWLLPPAMPWGQYAHVGFWVMWDKIIALLLIAPTAFLLSRTDKSSEAPSEKPEEPKNRWFNYTILASIVAAILMIANALLIALEEAPKPAPKLVFTLFDTEFTLKFGVNSILSETTSFNYIWVALGIGVLACVALLWLRPEKKTYWSILIFVFSCISVVAGGGFIIGLFLGVFAGIFSTLKSRFSVPWIVALQILAFFLLAFIGNEADNAMGACIFATPFVYNTLWGYELQGVRDSFMIAPFFYPILRIIQAVLTTLIAVPLMRNLKAAGLILTGKSAQD